MASLLESAELFETSTRLESAASRVYLLAAGQSLSEQDSLALRWAGDLLTRVDWSNEGWGSAHVSPDIASQATSVRPKFYAALRTNRDDFASAGLLTSDEVLDFLKRLYVLLSEDVKKSGMDQPQLYLAAQFLHDIAQALFLELTHNGEPEDPPSFSPGP